MRTTTLTAAIFLLAASMAHAGPFRGSVAKETTQTCTSDGCSVTRATTETVVRGRSAQDVAETMAATGRLAHTGNDGAAWEGLGCGGSPAEALRNCCRSNLPVRDQGVAYGRGRWWACRRHW